MNFLPGSVSFQRAGILSFSSSSVNSEHHVKEFLSSITSFMCNKGTPVNELGPCVLGTEGDKVLGLIDKRFQG
jgi:hypothetical protein